MQSTSDHLCVLVADSRANNFDKYKQPHDLNIHYIIQRGATIEQLTSRTRTEIVSLTTKKYILVKIAAGINDILEKYTDCTGTHIRLSTTSSAETIINKLLVFRSVVKTLIPSALVGFVTIPTAHLPSIQQHNIDSKKTIPSSAYPLETLQQEQSKLNTLIDEINNRIRTLNSNEQAFCTRGCWTVSWHSYIAKLHSKRSGKGRPAKKHTRYMYGNLYDGLHAVSTVKRAWFQLVLRSFRAELGYTQREDIGTATVELEPIVSSDSDSDWILDNTGTKDHEDTDDYVHWKRVKRGIIYCSVQTYYFQVYFVLKHKIEF